MVFHDYDLGRLTGLGPSPDQRQTWATLNFLVVVNHSNTCRRSELGPHPLLIEIKDQDGALGTDVGPLKWPFLDYYDTAATSR
jgi:hypothetical protein